MGYIHNSPSVNIKKIFVMLCAIWYHLYNLKNVKNTLKGVLLSVKLQVSASFRNYTHFGPMFETDVSILYLLIFPRGIEIELGHFAIFAL